MYINDSIYDYIYKYNKNNIHISNNIKNKNTVEIITDICALGASSDMIYKNYDSLLKEKLSNMAGKQIAHIDIYIYSYYMIIQNLNIQLCSLCIKYLNEKSIPIKYADSYSIGVSTYIDRIEKKKEAY